MGIEANTWRKLKDFSGSLKLVIARLFFITKLKKNVGR